MAKNFHERLRDYYRQVALVLQGQADAAAIFPNPSDKGMNREEIYATFLKQHVPSKCKVVLGGFLFHEDGRESRQIDILVIGDAAPRFELFQKSFAPVEGTLCAVSIKSVLDTTGLEDALRGIASIPPTKPLGSKVNPLVSIPDYDDWPVKVIYASSGISPQALHNGITAFYVKNPDIPISRRPHFIHVAGSCLIARVVRGFSLQPPDGGIALADGEYFRVEGPNADAGAIAWLLHDIQKAAAISSQIVYRYDLLIDKVMEGF